jgi:curved DNA-binding protein CbpA
MQTLYDLLEALPNDDAEALRAAFRRAVKGAHPDIRPGDPDAARRFREIVRANEILGDAEQRAVYDDLVDLARQEQDQTFRYAIAARIQSLASGAFAFAGGSVLTVAGYLLFMQMSAASVDPANHVDVAMRVSPGIATVGQAGPTETKGDSASSAKPQGSGSPGETVVANAATPTAVESTPSADFGPSSTQASSAAVCLRAYGDGDLNAFADIAPEKRVEKASHARPAPPMARKPHYDQAAIAPRVLPLPRPRTAAQDPSRQEGFAALRWR